MPWEHRVADAPALNRVSASSSLVQGTNLPPVAQRPEQVAHNRRDDGLNSADQAKAACGSLSGRHRARPIGHPSDVRFPLVTVVAGDIRNDLPRTVSSGHGASAQASAPSSILPT